LGRFDLRWLRRKSPVGLLLSAALVGSAVFTTSGATAAPKPTVAEVQRKINRLQHEAEQATEQYNDTREALKSINVRLKAADGKLARQRAVLAKAKSKLGQLASETYRRGQLSTLDLLLADDPDDALSQAGYLPSLGQRQSRAINVLQAGEKKLAASQAEIRQQRDKAQAAKTRLQTTRDAVKKRLRQADAQLNSLSPAQRVTLRQNQDNDDKADAPTGGGKAFCAGKAVQAPSAAAKAAINFACGQLGEPYQWAADGPGSWDCSGLTMKSYAAAGVSLPHSSKMQVGYGTRVSLSAMLPGDLVFFYSPISHVSLYLGDGMMVTAPQTGSFVKVAKFFADPVAAVRLS
jgi:cell wall-associated NlpC family hydrolase